MLAFRSLQLVAETFPSWPHIFHTEMPYGSSIHVMKLSHAVVHISRQLPATPASASCHDREHDSLNSCCIRLNNACRILQQPRCVVTSWKYHSRRNCPRRDLSHYVITGLSESYTLESILSLTVRNKITQRNWPRIKMDRTKDSVRCEYIDAQIGINSKTLLITQPRPSRSSTFSSISAVLWHALFSFLSAFIGGTNLYEFLLPISYTRKINVLTDIKRFSVASLNPWRTS